MVKEKNYEPTGLYNPHNPHNPPYEKTADPSLDGLRYC